MDITKREEMLREAAAIYRKSGLYPEDQIGDLVGKLAGHGLWSMRQIASIIGIDVKQVSRRMEKASKTGGRFNPATLPLILEEIELAKAGESNELLTAKIWDEGTTPSFLAKLIGQPVSTVQLRAAKGRKAAGERDG